MLLIIKIVKYGILLLGDIMRKYIILVATVFAMILLSGLLSFKDKKIEPINKVEIELLDNEIDVFDNIKLSSIINLKNGVLIYDNQINTNETGIQNIDVYYKDENKNKGKMSLEINIVDDVKPIILSSSINVLVGSKEPIELKLFSADNYDSNPSREVIGEYNINKLGKYNLVLKVTDSSNNVVEKSFSLNVLSKIPNSKPSNSQTIYSDIISKHKTNKTRIGLDISRWQGEIDFNVLVENKVEFIMMRIGIQTDFGKEPVMDSYFINNITQANTSGIPVGLYFYSRATSSLEAINQAKWVVNQIKDYKIDMPISFDWESWSSFSSLELSLKDINNISLSFMDEITRSGYKAINYSSKYYLENIWLENNYPVWLAHYTERTSYKGEYMMWQLCNNGKIPGIKGYVDINVLYE